DHRDVVEPQKPTLEHVVTVAIDFIDPAREVDQELVEAALEPLAIGVAVPDPIHVEDPPHRPRVDRRGCKTHTPPPQPPSGAHAWTGGFRSPNSHSYAGSCPLGCWNCSKSSTHSWSLANFASTSANGTHWNARSHAANHGYSHLSGIDITRIEFRWRQWPLRI